MKIEVLKTVGFRPAFSKEILLLPLLFSSPF